jgi:hypothetical protein
VPPPHAGVGCSWQRRTSRANRHERTVMSEPPPTNAGHQALGAPAAAAATLQSPPGWAKRWTPWTRQPCWWTLTVSCGSCLGLGLHA